MSTKTAKSPKNAPTRGFEIDPKSISKPMAQADLNLRQRKVSKKYVPLIEACLSLKPGQGFTVPVPEGKSIENFKASVSTTLRARLEGKLTGRLSFSTTEDGKLAISMVKAK